MKRIAIILTLILGLAVTACKNGDDIGYLYGLWIVENVTVDGEVVFDAEIANENGIVMAWKFQNDIVQLSVTNELHEGELWTGLWQCDDLTYVSTIEFDFPAADRMPEFLLLSDRMSVESVWDAPVGDEWMIWNYLGPEGQNCEMVMHKL